MGAAGCQSAGTATRLKHEQVFTPLRTRQVVYDDTCQLQEYFSNQKHDYFIADTESEETTSPKAEEERGPGVEQITYMLAPGVQTRTFKRLLGQIYDRIPRFRRWDIIRVTVSYVELGGGFRAMPIGSLIRITLPHGIYELPYHPCMNAFFLGKKVYTLRQHLASSSKL
jgi:hypothetical protein